MNRPSLIPSGGRTADEVPVAASVQKKISASCQDRGFLRQAQRMNSNTPANASSSVATFLKEVLLPLFPQVLRESMERELPTVALAAYQLGVDVLVAEHRGLRFSEAVRRPEFLNMGRVYFGATNLLQWQLPPEIRAALSTVLNQAVLGNLEMTRRVLFAVARRTGDPEAALWTFILWVAVRLNLVVLTWDAPDVEVRGSLDEAEDHAETTLRHMLTALPGNEVQDADFRPLHVLLADTFVHLFLYDEAVKEALSGFSSDVIEELLFSADALGTVRSLDARPAAAFWSGSGETELGSQQIADRFPQHFTSPNLVEQTRTRTRRRAHRKKPTQDRVIDLLRCAAERES